MTVMLADPVSEVVAAAEKLLTRRTGASVTLVDPVDLGGSGRSIVLRVRVAENPFSLPRTLVIKQVRRESGVAGTRAVDPDDLAGDSGGAFLREAVSYQFATALATDSRPGAELLASDLDARLLVLSDLGDVSPISALLEHSDSDTVANTLMAMAQALGRMHAATVGREEDFTALLRRAGVSRCDDTVAGQVERAVPAVPGLLSEILGIDVSPDMTDQVAHAAKLFESRRFRAFSPSDLCPDNIIVNDEGVRFLDYEWGGFRDAMLDIAYALVSFPCCLCSLDLSEDRTQAMIEAWRAEVVGMWPALADNNVLATRMVEAQLIWVWLSTYLFLPDNHTRIAAVREHQLSVPRSLALMRRWDKLARSANRAGNTVVAHQARAIADRLQAMSVG
ncbi:kinase [Rhodococcus sp. WMMA185]|uniref:phosphotransferase family protein n=1 Tax=Rhodococcus sp. WMMA185 TaxID=679318 RepID=UPI000878D26C|nr:kinase [Rhodococcus sp. WMMA185]AOW92569.1 kinase [Rhodococcus sp. WMMA185]